MGDRWHNDFARDDAAISSAVRYAPVPPKQSEVFPLASWIEAGRASGSLEQASSSARAAALSTLPAVAFDLLHAIEVHPGWRKLSARHQRDFLVFASLATAGRTVAGNADEIAKRLGLKCSKRLYARISVWAKHGLVSKSTAKYTLDRETRRSTFVPGSSWQLLPADIPDDGNIPAAFTPNNEDEQKAVKIIATLEKTCGEAITGRSRGALYAAIAENEPGVRACWKEAKQRGNSPLRLFLRMVNDGDWRTKSAMTTARACRFCGAPGKDSQPHNCVSANRYREAA